MGTSSRGFESTLSSWKGGVSVLFLQELTSLVLNSVTLGMFHASGIVINIMALVSCCNPYESQLSSRLFLPTILFRLLYVKRERNPALHRGIHVASCYW